MKCAIVMMVVCCGAAVFAEGEEEVEEQEQVEQQEVVEQTERGKFKVERYQDLIDRQMFGEPPENYDPSKPPEAKARSSATTREERELEQQQERLKSAIHFAAINVAPDGEVYVGFTDNSTPKMPRTYYLKVGEVREGADWVVKEADAKKKSMTIENKEGIEVALTLGGDSSKNAGATARAGAGSRSVTSNKIWKKGGLANRMFAAPDSAAKSQEEVEFGNTMRDRRKARREQEKLDAAQRAEMEKAREAAREEARKEQERREAEEKALREAKEAETRRALDEMKVRLDQIRQEKEAADAQMNAGGVQTLEENGDEAVVEEGGEE